MVISRAIYFVLGRMYRGWALVDKMKRHPNDPFTSSAVLCKRLQNFLPERGECQLHRQIRGAVVLVDNGIYLDDLKA